MQRSQFVEIFVNLLQNAREAMGGKGVVEVSAGHGPGHSVVVTVADSGPGISPEKFHQIFESYYTTKEKGSGLGLAIVKHNTEIYGGTISLESDLGRGARFTLQFPARTLLHTAT
jgi:signal transduction histidine kinase